MTRPTVAIVSSLRFPGGTSTAVSAEIPVLLRIADVVFYDADVSMLRRSPVNMHLYRSLRNAGVPIHNAVRNISADVVLVHNPALFKFEEDVPFRMLARKVLVIMHENPVNAFSRPTFDYKRTLQLLRNAAISMDFALAPISAVNRRLTVAANIGLPITNQNWFNIWSGEILPPNPAPRDRRGRHSRPGLGKWPTPEAFQKCFPESSENHILGLPPRLLTQRLTGHDTNLYEFGSVPVSTFLQSFDFMVYFHSEALRESFGRTIAEAIAAGKLVITHTYLRDTFGDGCIYCSPDEVSDLVAYHVDNPAEYVSKIEFAQQRLVTHYGPESFSQAWNADLLAA